jgi:hypothetical protein
METAMTGIDRNVRIPLYMVLFGGHGGSEDVVHEPPYAPSLNPVYSRDVCGSFNYCQSFY